MSVAEPMLPCKRILKHLSTIFNATSWLHQSALVIFDHIVQFLDGSVQRYLSQYHLILLDGSENLRKK
jgi:hypothetical protein